jgi:hypothetical protein
VKGDALTLEWLQKLRVIPFVLLDIVLTEETIAAGSYAPKIELAFGARAHRLKQPLLIAIRILRKQDDPNAGNWDWI